MTLNRQDKEIVRRRFCAYCIKVMHGEALNYFDELERQRTREVTFSELLQKDMDSLYYCDDYNMADYFTVMGRQIPVRDEWISKALKKLPSKKREIILMLYFLDMTEKEIAACLKLVQSTVHYHKDDSLKLLRENDVMQRTPKKLERKRLVRYKEGAEMYSMGMNKFQTLAKDARAILKIDRMVLVDLDIFDEYLETFRV